MVDFTSLASIIEYMFGTLDTTIFGSVNIMIIAIFLVVFLLLMLFSANRFTIGGFVASLLLALGYYGYTSFGWIAPLGLLIAGAILFMAIIAIFK